MTTPFSGSRILTESEAQSLLAGNFYFNIHTAANSTGEIRGQLSVACPATGSTNLRTLQVALTKVVATTSGAAITSAIDAGIADAFSNDGIPTSFGPNGGFINFAAEPRSQTASRAEEAFAALGYAGNVTKAPVAPRAAREWSLWADIRGTGWNVDGTTGVSDFIKGNQLNITAGVGRTLTPNTLVGVVGGYEDFKYDVAALGGSLKGDGATIGGYFAHRFGGNLRFDAALAWTSLNYSVAAGTATGSFDSSRWLASAGITGTHRINVFVLEPSARLYVLWERQSEWIDSIGNLQAARDFSAGRAAVGSKVLWPVVTAGGWTISPYAGLYADWRFSTDDALPTASPVANIEDGLSGRVTAGLTASVGRSGTISAGGEYGGLGANYSIWSANVRGTWRF